MSKKCWSVRIMADRDVVLAKIDSIQRCLRRIEETTADDSNILTRRLHDLKDFYATILDFTDQV